MKLSFHVCNTPCAEEFYMGVNAAYEAYIVDVPDELFPAELLRVLKEQGQLIRNDNGEIIGRKSFKSVTAIAPLKEGACVEMILKLHEQKLL